MPVLKICGRFLFGVAVWGTIVGTVGFSQKVWAQADQQRYKAWNDPNAPQVSSSSDLKGLVKDLKALVQKAQQDRAANPQFLRDLKALAARYENPWNIQVLSDDFGDGDYVRDPRWSVTSGEYWVEQGYGLRNTITPVPTTSTTASKTQKVSKEQLALSILGAVLSGKKASVKNDPPAQVTAKPASILTRVTSPNSFSMTTKLSSWRAQGHFEIAMAQGTGGSGYRLLYTPGTNGEQSQLELLKVTIRGKSTLDVAQISPLEDTRAHTVSWNRTRTGQMKVSIDDREILNIRDQDFQNSFNVFKFTSAGADVIVRSVTILGAR